MRLPPQLSKPIAHSHMLNLLLQLTPGSLTSTLKYFLSALYNTAVRHQGKLSEKPWGLLTPHYKSERYHTVSLKNKL